jgi:hypothetical protein
LTGLYALESTCCERNVWTSWVGDATDVTFDGLAIEPQDGWVTGSSVLESAEDVGVRVEVVVVDEPAGADRSAAVVEFEFEDDRHFWNLLSDLECLRPDSIAVLIGSLSSKFRF